MGLSSWGKYEIIKLCISLGKIVFDLGREIVFWYNTRAVRKMYFFKIFYIILYFFEWGRNFHEQGVQSGLVESKKLLCSSQ